uniref:Uncharacterized protein n=1 Tax=Arundo donax TaxID=35708 RepID=A0A0A9B9C3_ARUDO
MVACLVNHSGGNRGLVVCLGGGNQDWVVGTHRC